MHTYAIRYIDARGQRGFRFFIRCVPFQTITSAMSTLTPPVALEDPANQSKVDYILEVSSATDFDYPPVSHSQPICSACRVYLLNVIR